MHFAEKSRALRSAWPIRTSAALACAVAIAGCAAPLAEQPWAAVPASEHASGARLVLTADDVLPYSTLRDALAPRIPPLRVAREADCAAIGMSGPNPVEPPTAPLVFVDGSPANGTCALLQLPVLSVERVEVYSAGVTGQPRLPRSPNGVILIYTKRS